MDNKKLNRRDFLVRTTTGAVAVAASGVLNPMKVFSANTVSGGAPQNPSAESNVKRTKKTMAMEGQWWACPHCQDAGKREEAFKKYWSGKS